MTSEGEHRKHPKLERPTLGQYHRCEWAIYGTSCSAIEEFVNILHSSMDDSFKMAYLDSDHGTPVKKSRIQIKEMVIQMDGMDSENSFDQRKRLAEVDFVLVNGNHYPAAHQIVFLDEKKRDSLERRVEQLDDIQFLIKEQSEQELFPFLLDRVTEETQVFLRDDLKGLINAIRTRVEANIPELKALILAGGKSTRMGIDKSQVVYADDMTQELRIAAICKELGLKCSISKAHDFHSKEISGIPVIKDRIIDMGPFGAIISAMMTDPNAAWLIVACDLPFIDKQTLEFLIEHRDHSKVATAFKAKTRPFPEPLITIYEPRSYARFLQFMSQGYSCPRKVIINSDTRVLDLSDDLPIRNVNTLEELEAAKEDLRNQQLQ